MTIQENIPLAPLTTLQVGGAARYFAQPQSEDDVSGAVQFAKARDLPLLVLGGGSNVVIADSGWPGLAIKISLGGIDATQSNDSNSVLFSAGAGVDWDDFVAEAVARNCAGVECLSGIPGSVGATPVQNVGAYGQEVADTIDSVRALDMRENSIVALPNSECEFHYRTSIFNRSERGRYIILRVDYKLRRGGVPTLKYADLQKYFDTRAAARKSPPSLAETRAAVCEIRRSKGMLIVPGDDDCRSAGSFFKNPVLSEAEFQALTERAAARGLALPGYPALEAQVAARQHKISAAWLVEHSGFAKGYTAGAAGISRKHALALVNCGGATASDIVRLEDEIQRGVQQAWGILLEPEPVFVGFQTRV